MARTGRKSKPGKRVNGGRHSRAGQAPSFDKGTERTQAMQSLYGSDSCDAIGRAYRAGLLGTGNEAKVLLDTARRISNAYWQAYATGSYTCPLGERTFGSVVDLDHERIKRREQWLGDSLGFVRGMGPQVDRAFRQLVVDVNPDCGPSWLDRLCWASRQGLSLPASNPDAKSLRAALDALEQLAG
jgi:hypothetical protein